MLYIVYNIQQYMLGFMMLKCVSDGDGGCASWIPIEHTEHTV